MAEYDDTDRRDDDRRPSAAAAGRVKAPGLMLILYGILMVLLSLLSVGLLMGSPDTIAKPYHEMMLNMTKGAPQQPGQPPVVPPYEEFKQSLVVQGTVGGVLTLVLGLLSAIGGMKMRSLSGWGLALTGAIAAIMPCSFPCCLLGMPVGIWALIVLVNADVKAAFKGSRPADTRDRDEYDGDRR